MLRPSRTAVCGLFRINRQQSSTTSTKTFLNIYSDPGSYNITSSFPPSPVCIPFVPWILSREGLSSLLSRRLASKCTWPTLLIGDLSSRYFPFLADNVKIALRRDFNSGTKAVNRIISIRGRTIYHRGEMMRTLGDLAKQVCARKYI